MRSEQSFFFCLGPKLFQLGYLVSDEQPISFPSVGVLEDCSSHNFCEFNIFALAVAELGQHAQRLSRDLGHTFPQN